MAKNLTNWHTNISLQHAWNTTKNTQGPITPPTFSLSLSFNVVSFPRVTFILLHIIALLASKLTTPFGFCHFYTLAFSITHQKSLMLSAYQGRLKVDNTQVKRIEDLTFTVPSKNSRTKFPTPWDCFFPGDLGF